MLKHLKRGRTGDVGFVQSHREQVKGLTHGVRDVYIRRGDPLVLSIRNFYFLHIPDTKSWSRELRPDLTPAFVLVRLVPILVPVEFVNESAREISLLLVCEGERDDRADFRVQGRIISWNSLLHPLDRRPGTGEKVGYKQRSSDQNVDRLGRLSPNRKARKSKGTR